MNCTYRKCIAYQLVTIRRHPVRLERFVLMHAHRRRYANQLKETLAIYRKAEDLINIGAYVAGSNPKIDFAIEMIEKATKQE